MTKTRGIPEGLRTLTAQVTVEGAADAIEFYKRALGAVERSRANDPSGTKIWHAELCFGDSVIFINDAFPGMGAPAQPTKLWIYSDDVDGLFRRSVEAGAEVVMPLADMFWGDRMAEVKDRWGNHWALAQRVRELTPEQMQSAQDAFVASMKR